MVSFHLYGKSLFSPNSSGCKFSNMPSCSTPRNLESSKGIWVLDALVAFGLCRFDNNYFCVKHICKVKDSIESKSNMFYRVILAYASMRQKVEYIL